MLEGKPLIKFYKAFTSCDVFTGSLCFGKLLLQASFKWAKFAEEITLVFCGQVSKMEMFPPESWSSALGLCSNYPQFLQSLWRRVNAWNIGLLTLYCSQFMFSTQLLTLNYLFVVQWHLTNVILKAKFFPCRNISVGVICTSRKLWGNIFCWKGEQLRLNQLLVLKRGTKFARRARCKILYLEFNRVRWNDGMMEWWNGGIS